MSKVRPAALASSPPSVAAAAAAPAAPLPGSERLDYRGKCRYKTGKCMQERALKTSGVAHNLCDEHRNRQNQHQRKLDAKNRQHKREHRVGANEALIARFAPYPTAAKTAKRESLTPSIDTSDDGEAGDKAAVAAAVPASGSGPSATSLTSTTSSSAVLAAAATGVMLLPSGPQPPQVACPLIMQNFDGIVVPLPSYLEGEERIEFRSRIYQKVLDFISEECVSRFGAKVESTAVHGDDAQRQAKCAEYASAVSNRVDVTETVDVQQSLSSGTEEAETSSTAKRKH
uniref:Uncharacterized protein n=1 Tax=Peronospora matthiolae TaxID=2874970 RepID=A0AAV1TC11_9STRA